MVDLKNIHFYYKKGVPVLENLSLNLKGGIYGLLGENGVGKTTLFHLIAGMLFPKQGDSKVIGYEPQKRIPDMYNHLFFLPETMTMPKESIYEFSKRHAVFYPDFSRQEMDENLEEFGIDGNRKLSDYSFGQQKSVMLAYVLALNTKITLLDEPTVGLSFTNKTKFNKLIAKNYNPDRCIVISSHYLKDLENLLDHVLIMDEKQIIFDRSIEEVAERLFFFNSDTKPEEVLYSEQDLQGYNMVVPNAFGQESQVRIDLLYRAVLMNRERVSQLFN